MAEAFSQFRLAAEHEPKPGQGVSKDALPEESLFPMMMIVFQVGGTAWASWGFLIVIFAIFYLLLIMPQQRRQRRWQQMLSNLKNGDKVVTQGGISGTIIALRDQFVHLRVPPDNIKIEVARNAVVSVVNPEEPAKT